MKSSTNSTASVSQGSVVFTRNLWTMNDKFISKRLSPPPLQTTSRGERVCVPLSSVVVRWVSEVGRKGLISCCFTSRPPGRLPLGRDDEMTGLHPQKNFHDLLVLVLVLVLLLLHHHLLFLPPRWPSGKASASRAEDPGFDCRLCRDFFGVESYQWLQNWNSSGYPARRLAL